MNTDMAATGPQKSQEVEIDESELEQVEGGVLIGLLLPAVQKVRDAAATPPSALATEQSAATAGRK